jgi:thiamine-monophosphate kinase
MSEREWIHKYIRPLVRAGGADDLRDDVAMLRTSGVMIATLDTLVEGVHFLASDPLDTVGQKLIRVNVSDIYAKAALPREALLSVAWPKGRAEAEFAALMAGVAKDLKAFEFELIGGDFVSTDGPLVLSLALTGLSIGAGPVRRTGGIAPGDKVWVSGQIGHGAIGLEAALNGGPASRIQNYRVPRLPEAKAAQLVATFGKAAMDVSDGLLQDVETLVSVNGRGAGIDLNRIELAEPSHDLARVMMQVTGGDDYQILVVSAPDTALPPEHFSQIGEIVSAPGLLLTFDGVLVNLPETLGFEHR